VGAEIVSDVMPLMPAMRPRPHQRSQLANPIRMPPSPAVKYGCKLASIKQGSRNMFKKAGKSYHNL
jgi:hypothetical protein